MSATRSTLLLPIAILAVGLVAPARPVTAGTFVTFTTNLGAFDVELYDASMPTTVANFLGYVNSHTYDSTIIHRSTTYNPADIQVVQGGGYVLAATNLAPVVTGSSIALEAGSSNLRGTIAMARGSATNSATSQFYFNARNNPGLDGNYAVFGSVVGTAGLAVLDALAAVTVYDASPQLGAPYAELPLLQPSLQVDSLVLVQSVVAVPEPSTLVLAATGLAACACRRRTR
jgi:cyclophilin family peptidyl-prolyl cis-trans isomerase